jgi:hypothetical protein
MQQVKDLMSWNSSTPGENKNGDKVLVQKLNRNRPFGGIRVCVTVMVFNLEWKHGIKSPISPLLVALQETNKLSGCDVGRAWYDISDSTHYFRASSTSVVPQDTRPTRHWYLKSFMKYTTDLSRHRSCTSRTDEIADLARPWFMK